MSNATIFVAGVILDSFEKWKFWSMEDSRWRTRRRKRIAGE
jgi:hypothetical protein